MEKEKRELIENNLGLAHYVSHKWEKKLKNSYDIILSDCFIGLVKAANAYDLNRKVSFATFSIKCMENEILMRLRKEKKFKKEICFSSFVVMNEDGEELNIIDLCVNDSSNINDWIKKEEFKSDVRRAFESLKPKEREIFLDYYSGIKQKDIAEKYSYTRTHVNRVINNCRKKLSLILKN